MRFPWVSRELYNRVVSDLEESRKDRRELLDIILGKTAEVAQPAAPPEEELDVNSVTNPITGKLDADKLRRMATKAKAVQAGLIAR